MSTSLPFRSRNILSVSLPPVRKKKGDCWCMVDGACNMSPMSHRVTENHDLQAVVGIHAVAICNIGTSHPLNRRVPTFPMDLGHI